MALLMGLIALVAFIAAILSIVRKQWRLAAIYGVIFVLALLINARARTPQAQQAAQQGNFPIPLNSGGTIPK